MEKKMNLKKNPKILIFSILTVLFLSITVMYAAVKPEAANNFSGLTRFMGMLQTTLVYGVFYALLALGFALIFGAARVR